MKSYDEYYNEYLEAIKPGLEKGARFIIRECVFISMKWQTDNNWNPWDKDALERLKILKNQDIRLYLAVVDGIDIVMSSNKYEESIEKNLSKKKPKSRGDAR